MEKQLYSDFELYDIVTSGDQEELASIKEVTLQGWVRTNRDNGSIGFIEFNDGTYFKNVQLVYSKDSKDYDVLSSLGTGFAIEVSGELRLTPENKQPFEIFVNECKVCGKCDEDYPLQKKRH